MSHALITPPTLEPLSLAQGKQHLRATTDAEDALILGMIAASRRFAEAQTGRQIIAARYKLVLDSFDCLVALPVCPVLQVVSVKYLDEAGVQQTVSSADYVVDLVSEPARMTPAYGKTWPCPLPQIGAVEIIFDAGYAAPLTASASTDAITIQGWKTLAVNDVVRLVNRDKIDLGDGALPAPLTADRDYYVQSVVSAGVYKLSLTAGGAAIDLTSDGTGDNFVGDVPDGLKCWMLLRMGVLYDNRAQLVIGERINMQVMPNAFVDGMLDPYRVYGYGGAGAAFDR